jgi:hypothetical protein
MAQNFENMPEEQLRQERAERRSALEKAPAATPEQAFVKEAAVALREVQEQLEDEVRAGAAAAPGAAAAGAAAQGAEGQEQAGAEDDGPGHEVGHQTTGGGQGKGVKIYDISTVKNAALGHHK